MGQKKLDQRIPRWVWGLLYRQLFFECPSFDSLCLDLNLPLQTFTCCAASPMCSSQVFHCPLLLREKNKKQRTKNKKCKNPPPCERKIKCDCYLCTISEFGEKFEKWVQFQWIKSLKSAFRIPLEKNIYFLCCAKTISFLNTAITHFHSMVTHSSSRLNKWLSHFSDRKDLIWHFFILIFNSFERCNNMSSE